MLKRWSNGSLALLFIFSLLSFIALRWNPEPWLRTEIDGMARQAGVGLQFRSLSLDGLAVRMDDVSLDLPGAAVPVAFDRLTISPGWLALLTGKPSGDVSLLWHGQTVRFSLKIRGRDAELHLPDSVIAVAALGPLWQKAVAVPASLAGDIHLRGDVELTLPDGHPVAGKVELEWRHARASLFGNAFALGSYRVQGSGEKGVWHLDAAGGDGARLEASGSLDASKPDFRAWTLRAQGKLSAKEGSMLAGMMGAQPLQFDLSGPAMAPQWHMSARQIKLNSNFLRL